MKTQHLTIERNQTNQLIDLLNQKVNLLKQVLRKLHKNLEGLSAGAGYALRH